MKNIIALREKFYLDMDGECRWNYSGLVESEEGHRFIASINSFDDEEVLKTIPIGSCNVCGKMPLKYNFVLKYFGTEKRGENDFKYSVVGSECIESLTETDMLKISRDKRLLKEKKDVSNGRVIGRYIQTVFLSQNPQLWNMSWKYFDKVRNLGGSLRFLSEKCLSGIALQEKTFGKELKKALKDAGFPLPNLREIKNIIGEVKPEEDGPTYEDYRADEEAIREAENGFESMMEQNLDEPQIPDSDVDMDQIVPEGMELKDIYGISPITGTKEVVYMVLVDRETGKEIKPTSEGIMESWNPVIEVQNGENIMHIHLQKWLKMKNNTINPLLKALKAISGDDMDFASEENGIGFSGVDTEFGHSLASREFLTEKQIPYAKKLVRKYKRQLIKNYPEIWEEVKNEL